MSSHDAAAGSAARLIRFEPASAGVHGRLRVPGDKSISHRAAMVASLCEGPIEILNFLRADDTISTLNALSACGVAVGRSDADDPVVQGAGLRGLRAPRESINIGNSGTSIRLLPGIFAGQRGTFSLDGDASIRRRPMDRIVEPLRRMGVSIEATGGRFAPITVTGGPVHATTYLLPVASAQVKSAVLLAALFGDGPTTVVEPSLCRDHTEIMLRHAGVRVEKEGLKTTICPPDRLVLDRVEVVPDFSSAAFFIVAAAVIPGSELVIEGVGVNPTRTGLIDVMLEMGAAIALENRRDAGGEPVADIVVRHTELQGAEVGGEISGRAIDELPLLALLGAFAQGQTVVRGAAELKVKESDRIAALSSNMAAIGVKMNALEDGFVVQGAGGFEGGLFKSMGDHRMAMLGAIAGLASRSGVGVAGFGCVSVSFPDFEPMLRGTIPEGTSAW